jgi:hypothetical protein
MFSLAYDKGHKVLRARFEGVLSSQDIEELDRAVIAFTAREGPTHGLVDFSAVDLVAMPATMLAKRSQQPPFSPGYKRVFVVSPQALELARTFAGQQAAAGMGSVDIVTTLAEAYRILRLPKVPRFEPVDLGGLA